MTRPQQAFRLVRVYFFDVLTETFREYDAALKMPLECVAFLVPFEDKLYLTTNNHFLDPDDRTV